MKKNIKGSEKQIKWANDILDKAYSAIEENDKAVKEHYNEKRQSRWNRISGNVINHLDGLEDAGEIISKYQSITSLSNIEVIFELARIWENTELDKLSFISALVPRETIPFN